MDTITLALWISLGLAPFWLSAAMWAEWLVKRAGAEVESMTDTVAAAGPAVRLENDHG